MRNQPPEIVLRNITKKMEGLTILHPINLSIQKGECIVLLGPSGCGKTTLLRLVSGLEVPDSGDILFRNKSILSLPPHKRNFSMMFQDFALFPHRNVFENIAFGLEMKKMSRSDIAIKVSQMLELVNLEGFEQRHIGSLSGGESQRVALARALAPEPDCIMLDEPLGALDRTLKERLLEDLIYILRKVHTTTIFVTHDQKEAFSAADRICVMSSGRVEQVATSDRLYHHPVSRTVAEFLGLKNIIPCRKTPSGKISTLIGTFMPDDGSGSLFNDMDIQFLLILPNYVTVVSEEIYNSLPGNKITGELFQIIFTGESCNMVIRTATGVLLTFYMPPDSLCHKRGDQIFLSIHTKGLCVFQQERQ